MLQTKLEWDGEVEIEIKEGEEIHNPDPYDFFYSNIPKKPHVLKTEGNCRFCHAKNSGMKLRDYAAEKDR